MRIAGIIAVSALLAIAGLPKAAAQSPYCLPLQLELAELEKSRSAGNGRALRHELDRARAEERRAGCRSFFRSRSTRSACRSIRSRISSLERQLSGSGFGGLFGRSPVERRRAHIRDALRRNGCSTYAARTFRTICVRLCDGYYFPLSNTSSRQRFSQDAQKCMGQYAPGQAALFYHPFPNGDASQAVSLDGERYFDLPYAFAFRTQFMPHCAAQLHDGLAALGKRVSAAVSNQGHIPAAAPASLGAQFEAAALARMEAFSAPIPTERPDWSSDPESLANRAGGLVPTQLAAPRRETALVGDASRSVGEPYYFVETNPGPPQTVAGYKPPERKDFRVPPRASILPVAR